MATAERIREGFQAPLLTEKEAELTKAATKCLIEALDRSRASTIKVVEDCDGTSEGPVLHLPPSVLQLMAKILSHMADRRPLTLVPSKHELSTMDAANLLNVSRPFVIKEIKNGRIKCHLVGTHRRIDYEDLMAYKNSVRASQKTALDSLVEFDQEHGLE